MVLILGFHDDGADEFEDVAMFQCGVNLHFLIYRFAILFRRLVGDVDQFACCHLMVSGVYGLEDAKVYVMI